MDDRIKLAEAIWKRPPHEPGWEFDFDPFTDANDDYAVLEWMRSDRQRFTLPRWAWDYEIGDYARAALKVIGETK